MLTPSLLLLLLLGAPAPQDVAPDGAGIAFERRRLSDVFFSEGANTADFDRDGHGDVVSGPYWYAGPDFERRHAVYGPEAFDPARYSDNFFAWPRDFDGDGWTDVLFVGFPGKEAAWYRNPGKPDQPWQRHLAFSEVDNESPAFVDLTGDGAPEPVFHTRGIFGWAAPDAANPTAPWAFRAFGDPMEIGRFTHGLGVGDVNGDGEIDVLWTMRWW